MNTPIGARRVAVGALVLLTGLGASAQAQNAVITGTVRNSAGQTLPGVNVHIAEMAVSVGTNAQGAYTITIPAARVAGQQVVLRARIFGYVPGARPLTITAGSHRVDFSLRQDVNRLETVVVTGVTAGTETKKLAFSVAQVSEKDMPVPGTSPLTQIQGKVPGVNIASTSGRPGRSQSVLLRGPQSINAEGRSQEPLYIVDGIAITGSLPDINPMDIESVEVVKGAAASTAYGTRAGAGVIQITTKSGRNASDGVRFNGRAEYGQGDIEKEYHFARATMLQMDETRTRFCRSGTNCTITVDFYEEARRVNELGGEFALPPTTFERDHGIGAAPPAASRLGLFQVTRWPVAYNPIAQTVTPGAFINSSLDATGRFGPTSFFASANNFQQEGAIRFVPGYTRNSLRLNVDQQAGSDWAFGLRSFYSTSLANGIDHDDGGTGFFRLTRQPAGVDLLRRDSRGRLFVRSNPLNQGGQNQNPLYVFESWTSRMERERFLGNFTSRYTPFSWAELQADLGYDRGTHRYLFRRDKGYRTTSQSSLNNGDLEREGAVNSSYNAGVSATARRNFGSDLQTRYTARYLFEQQDFDYFDLYGITLAAPGITTPEGLADPNTYDPGGRKESIRSIGVMAGVDAEYKERYILGLLGRRDGSSLFGSANRWANYGRASVAWRVAQEPWWFTPNVNELKLRASLGTAGNRPRFSAQYETFNIGAGGSLSASTLGNKNLRPETVTEMEIGVDAEVMQRFGLTVNYAYAVAKDQILEAPPSLSSGFTNQWLNAGTLVNRTWEASLNIPLLQRRNMNWSMRINYDRNRAVIDTLFIPEFFDGPSQQGAGSMFRFRSGERYGTFYGRRFVTSCGELPVAHQAQCGGAGSQFQRNGDGYIVWTGGASLGEGITRNLWQAALPGCVSASGAPINVTGEIACRASGGTPTAPWGMTASWGHPMVIRDSTGAAQQLALGNSLPDYRLSMSHTFNWNRLFIYGLLDGVFGREVWNEGRHWSLGDFMTAETDQLGKSVEDAKPIGYYWRAREGGGSGGFYDILGPSSHTVEDATYVKLREVNVSYNIGPVRGVGDWTVALIGRNLKTWTKYKGFDPEVGWQGGGTTNVSNVGPTGSALINALDAYSFPNLRTFTLALNTRF